MERFALVMALTGFIHLVITLSYAVRLAGLRTGRLLTAVSIFNVINLLAGAANTVQAPLLTSAVEHAIKAGLVQAGTPAASDLAVQQQAYREQLSLLAGRIRLVILSSTAGTLAGALFTPAFVRIFARAIHIFEEAGSVPGMFVRLIFSYLPARIKRGGLFVLPRLSSLFYWAGRRLLIPRTFLAVNVFVTGLFTTGVLSALYAGALYPDFRSTAAALSAIVNGVAVAIVALVVEPTASLITDEAMQGKRGEEDVKQMAFYMIISRILGTLLAHALFLPCARLIKYVVMLLSEQ
ncbi:MAG: DUF2837 family protein [Pelotomaculum sp.]|uniref:Lipid II flippase Amj n=1 Tax=Pelotomaculum thermopropionicum (strain DSM 13744 / JCM 10971 / SI) TaxID=370438 RepID=A5D3A3_PELTS|nr:DUF2837 family protein [Pelotomaculum sp.]BAF59264.1 hypothetical protein PTH_1083 [Pelotomaculum thermopropionicum SI]